MEWKLELVLVPVSDVDRAKEFYVTTLGFTLDVDHQAGDSFRVVQVTPPGSACSISFGVGITDATPGSVIGLHLVVTDIEAAARALAEAGVEADDIHHFEAGGKRVPGPHPDRADYGSFMGFKDPDGNTFVVQEVRHGGADT